MCMISSFLSPSVPLTSISAGKSKWRVQSQVREAVSKDTCHSVHPARQSFLTQHLKFFHALLKFYTPGMTMNRHNISIVLLVERNNNCSMAWEGGNLIMSRGAFLHLT